MATEEMAKVTASLQQDTAVLPNGNQAMFGLFYNPPTVLLRLLAEREGALSPIGVPLDEPGTHLVVHHQDDGSQVLVIDRGEDHSLECVLDAGGLPVLIDDRGPRTRRTIEFEYDDRHQLQRETLILFVAGHLVQSLQAEHSYGQNQNRRSIVIKEMGGRVVEEQTFNEAGQLSEWHTINDVGRITCREQFHYTPQGLLDSSYRQRFAAQEPWQPVRDWTETREYDPRTGNLSRCTIVERTNDAPAGALPAWTSVAVEVIDYDPDHNGVPLRDETQYLDRGPFGDPVLCKRILMHYGMIDPQGDAAIQVIEEDLCTGEVRERWCRQDNMN